MCLVCTPRVLYTNAIALFVARIYRMTVRGYDVSEVWSSEVMHTSDGPTNPRTRKV